MLITLPPSCTDFREILEPSGPVQDSKMKVLPFADFSYSFTHCTREAIKYLIEASVLVISAIEDS